MVVSLACMALAVGVLWRWGAGRWLKALALALMCALLLVSLFWLAANLLTGEGINYSVLYHLEAGMQGADFAAFAQEIALISALLLAVVLALVWLWRRVPAAGYKGRKWGGPLMAVLLAVAVASNAGVHDLLALWATPSAADEPDPRFVMVQPERVVRSMRSAATRPASAGPSAPQAVKSELTASPPRSSEAISADPSPKNLILLYLESFERSYLDESVFPGLTPSLNALRTQGLDFTQVHHLSTAGWTMGGMVATQCGMPLFAAGGANIMSQISSFLAGATCLGDVLKAAGYNLAFVGGADLSFAGKGNFYRTHGFERVTGLRELTPQLDDPKYVSGWGLYDDSLFEFVRKTVSELAAQPEPYAVVALTLDTHFPEGHIPASCAQRRYGDGTNPMLNAVHCSDFLVGQWVAQLREQVGADTLIAVMSDHLSMPNTAQEQLESLERRNLWLLLGEGVEPAQVARAVTHLDVAPTLLERLGVPVTALGYGVDALGEAPTLIEEQGDGSKVDRYLHSKRAWLNGFWRYPSVLGPVRTDAVEGGRFYFNDTVVQAPFLMMLNDRHETRDVYFATSRNVAYYFADQPLDDAFLWVDECDSLLRYLTHIDTPGEWCYAVGKPGAQQFVSGVVAKGEVFDFAPALAQVAEHPVEAKQVLEQYVPKGQSMAEFAKGDDERRR